MEESNGWVLFTVLIQLWLCSRGGRIMV